MKSFFLVFLSAAFLLAACGSNDTTTPATPGADSTATPQANTNPDYAKGLALVAKSDCLTCHKISEKLVGPAYADVAAKYPATPENITRLGHTIIEGVTPEKAVWGTVPMTPHPQLSQADAEQMVKYIMTLKK